MPKSKLFTTLFILCLVVSSTAAQDAPTVAVGDPALKGITIGAYNATWSQSTLQDGEWRQVATLTDQRNRPIKRVARCSNTPRP